MIAYVDGARTEADTAAIPIHDRGFLFGDGVYDTCRVWHGRYLRFMEHAERFSLDGRTFPSTEAVERLTPAYWARVREACGG